ncbi:hypothetical protein C2E25_03155 [Geothermobacter hydrogeniphilus]|uniref:rRNA methylase n=1 Tax=Geothermobacter hydrogeniphilus TaxID=1969733 RepID=A0A2K2HDE3_9BACT|nr:class I SAM-dependent methyltransferase [Geothermobacter hydrogeniphilus]PNU21304.1 hypothetical protein C2E25_03155 [Geothermobacter hydrogeniphilus]
MRSPRTATPPESLVPRASLGRVVVLAQRLLAEVVRPDARLLDLTAGNGCDSLFLARHLGPDGQLLSFDIQLPAIEATAARLAAAGFLPRRVSTRVLLHEPGCQLIHDGHQFLDAYLSGPVAAAIGNLGYLPGGDKRLITRAETTLAALRALWPRLEAGGRLALVLYPGHPGGDEECVAVERECAGLPTAEFDVIRLQVHNRCQAPSLLVVERRL